MVITIKIIPKTITIYTGLNINFKIFFNDKDSPRNPLSFNLLHLESKTLISTTKGDNGIIIHSVMTLNKLNTNINASITVNESITNQFIHKVKNKSSQDAELLVLLDVSDA